MGLFGWGNKDEEWMQTTRRVPDWVKAANIQDGDPRWIVSQEFADPKKKNKRVYYAALKHFDIGTGQSDWWLIGKYETDLKGNSRKEMPQVIQGRSSYDSALTPAEVILRLRAYERYCFEKGMIPVPVATANYIKFANAHGLHVNDDGDIIPVPHDKPVLQNTLMTTEGLKKLFREASKQRLHTWQDVYDQVINKPSADGVTVADLAADPAWPDLVKVMSREFPNYSLGWDSDPFFATKEKRAYADYLIKSKRLLSSLLAGAEDYDKILLAIEEGKGVKAKSQSLRNWIKEVRRVSAEELGLSKEAVEDIVNIMRSGPPGELPPLPHERMLKDNPPTPRKEPKYS